MTSIVEKFTELDLDQQGDVLVYDWFVRSIVKQLARALNEFDLQAWSVFAQERVEPVLNQLVSEAVIVGSLRTGMPRSKDLTAEELEQLKDFVESLQEIIEGNRLLLLKAVGIEVLGYRGASDSSD